MKQAELERRKKKFEVKMKIPLPTIDGIGPSCVRIPPGPWRHVLEYLQERFPKITPETWISRMEKGEVVDEHGTPMSVDSPCQKDTLIFYYRELKREIPIPFQESILYQDDHILVADKPHFLPVIPSGRFLRETLLVRLKRKLEMETLVPLHRIDRETAGLVMFSLNPETRHVYTSLFTKHTAKKVYEAVAPILPGCRSPITHCSRLVKGEPFFRMKETEGTPNSKTVIEVMENRETICLYRLIPVTGKQHQLRVHCAALEIPIVNDRLYPEVHPLREDDFSSPLQLVARSISFQDPLTRQVRYFESNAKLEW